MNYFKWAPGEPNNLTRDQSVIAFRANADYYLGDMPPQPGIHASSYEKAIFCYVCSFELEGTEVKFN